MAKRNPRAKAQRTLSGIMDRLDTMIDDMALLSIQYEDYPDINEFMVNIAQLLDMLKELVRDLKRKF